MKLSAASASMRRIFAVSLLSLIPGAGGCQWMNEGWNDFAAGFNGQEAEQADETQRAEAAAEAVYQARLHRQGGNLDQALLWFHRALEEDTRQLEAHVGIGDIYQVRGDYAAAAGRYETARRIDPTDYHATYNLGLMYHLLNRVRDAVGMYLSALSIEPDSYDANFNLATAYLQIDQAGQALPYARRAAELEPSTQASFVNLGAVYAALGRHEEAIEAYRQAEQQGPYSSQLTTNLVNALVRSRQYEQAIAVIEEALNNEPSARYFERLGYVNFRLGRYQQSLEAYDNALQMEPDETAALNGAGVSLMTLYIQGDRNDHALHDRAIKSWRQSLSISPDQRRIVDLI
ncbi:MAG: tetratricopeptide repeat protein, partial [Phycisphaeraceae bacterium]